MSSQPHILLVDDERDIRDPLAAYLSKNDLRVTKAESAAVARQILAVHAIDLVLLDIMMPGEDGLSLAGFVRATSGIPIILLTAKPSWIAAVPTPPAPACTSSVSPACSRPRRCSPTYPVW